MRPVMMLRVGWRYSDGVGFVAPDGSLWEVVDRLEKNGNCTSLVKALQPYRGPQPDILMPIAVPQSRPRRNFHFICGLCGACFEIEAYAYELGRVSDGWSVRDALPHLTERELKMFDLIRQDGFPNPDDFWAWWGAEMRRRPDLRDGVNLIGWRRHE